jgi:hypothetical protein
MGKEERVKGKTAVQIRILPLALDFLPLYPFTFSPMFPFPFSPMFPFPFSPMFPFPFY